MPLTLTNEKLIAQLFDQQPDSVVWFVPLLNPDDSASEIMDFDVHYCNEAACKILNAPKETVLATTLKNSPLMDDVSKKLIFEQCLQVWQTGEAIEYTYYSPYFDKYFNVQRSKVEDGILSITRDRTEFVRAEIEMKEKTELVNGIIESSASAIVLYDSMYNDDGVLVDFQPKLFNKKSYELAALTADDIKCKSLRSLIAESGSEEFFIQAAKVLKTGEPFYTDLFWEAANCWLAFSIVKFGNGILVNYVDISETKKYEQEAKENAKELNAIFNSSLSAVYSAQLVKDAAGTIIDLTFLKVNLGFCRMIGLKEGQLVGAKLTAISPDPQHHFIAFVQKVVASGEPIVEELFYESSNRWFEFSMVKLDEDKIAVTYNEITEKKNILLEIEKQKVLMDKILQQSPSGIAVTKAIRNKEGKMVDAVCTMANDMAEQFTGIPKEVSLSKTSGEIDPQILESPLFSMALHTLETGESFRTEYYLNPTQKWLELGVAKLDNDHFVNVFTDITLAKEAQKKLELSMEELKRSNANLEEFAYVASHDLKEPIRKIRFFTNRLKDQLASTAGESGLKDFERLDAATSRMNTLIDDLLTYSQISYKPQQNEEVDLNQKLQLVLTDLEVAVYEKKAKITSGELPVIYGNDQQIQQLLQNLIANALKYAKADVEPQIKIEAKIVSGENCGLNLTGDDLKKNYHLITVTDNGIGFEQSNAEKIFQVFQRLHGNIEYKGTGIGLSIARKVVENHKGFIWAKSEPDAGATFHILFPVEA